MAPLDLSTSTENPKNDKMLLRFLCDQCNYKATRKDTLFQHINSIHKGIKFPCDQCEYKAGGRGTSLNHIRSIHKGVK